MKQTDKHIRSVIISGGGTGGHIFPAISIADELKRRDGKTRILFVGARGRMEMERVPAAGYEIEGLPVSGLQRKITLRNIVVLINLFRSILLASRIVSKFRPDVVIGVGGYASGPVLRAAAKKGIPILLQEQNSYAGITNKWLAKKASKICVAYRNMEKFFPKDKIVFTGNPVRNIVISDDLRKEGVKHFSLRPDLPVLIVVGGSLGAGTINEAMFENIGTIKTQKFQVLWQTGKYYYGRILEK
ncbi:MAG: UDP-N-acetylglucosamine--N-acetylmuramyl-(pentapeptide) pyrophosphoryl-undecaprenol N-acetylglucosamine transferase, partial [Bacteroidales bacterium]